MYGNVEIGLAITMNQELRFTELGVGPMGTMEMVSLLWLLSSDS